MGIEKIGNMRYNYMMVAYELGILGGTLGLNGDFRYIRRSHFCKPQVFASIRDSPQGSREQYFVVLSA